jgi:hypothetical protein
MIGGLFGKKKQMPMPGVISGYGGGTFNVDGTPVTMDMIPTTAGGRYGDPMPQQSQGRPGLGTRLLGEGWEGKVAALGGALMGDPNALPQYMIGQEKLRQNAAEMAAKQQQAAARLAAAMRLGISEDQALALGDNIGGVVAAQMKPETPPAIQQNADYIRRTQGDAAADEYIRNFGRPQQTPVMMEIGGRPVFGTPEQIQSLLQSGAFGGQQQGGGNVPTVRGQSDYDALPPGAQYRDPQGNLRTKGGSGGNVGGGFRG